MMLRCRALVRLLAVSTALVSLTAVAAPADVPDGYERARDKAERFFAEGSFARARQLYEQLGDEQLPEAEARWVEFRTADSTWRAQAGSRTNDNTVFEAARGRLEALTAAIQRPEVPVDPMLPQPRQGLVPLVEKPAPRRKLSRLHMTPFPLEAAASI